MESDIDSLIFEDGEFQAGIARFARPLLSSREKTGYTPTGLYCDTLPSSRTKKNENYLKGVFTWERKKIFLRR